MLGGLFGPRRSGGSRGIQISQADVRAVLAVKTQNGMTAEVKGLITKYGGSKLSDVDPKHYADLIKDAEVLGNG